MIKFHVSADGTPRKCFAIDRPCPVGDAEHHYASEKEGRAAFEASQGSAVPEGAKKGFTVTSLVQTSDTAFSGEKNISSYQKLPIKNGFSDPKEAIQWAKDNIADATQLISVVNEDYEHSNQLSNDDPLEGVIRWQSLNLVDISHEKQILDSKDIPTIGKWYLKQYSESITDIHSLRRYTSRAIGVLNESELGRLRGYLKAATYGKNK